MTDEDAERAGLVSSHAYAMLDVKEVKGVKFFQLKNPWNHLRWKGRSAGEFFNLFNNFFLLKNP